MKLSHSHSPLHWKTSRPHGQVAGGNAKWYSSLESLGLQAAQGLEHLAKTKLSVSEFGNIPRTSPLAIGDTSSCMVGVNFQGGTWRN